MTKSKTKAAVRRRIITLWALAIALLLTITIALFAVFYPFKNSLSVKPSQITDARNQNESTYRDAKASRIDVLTRNGILTDHKADYSSSVDICEIYSSGGGWSINSWRQSCSIQDIELFSTKLSHEEVALKLSDTPNAKRLFSSSQPLKSTCSVVYKRSEATLSYISHANERENRCTVPESPQQESSARIKKKVLRSFDTKSISKSTSYIMITSTQKYFDTKLGCKSGTFLWCSNPLNMPVADW